MRLNLQGKLIILGYGSVSRCLLVMLKKDFQIDLTKVTILDAKDFRDDLAEERSRGLTFLQTELKKCNFQNILGPLVSRGDAVVDLTVSVDTLDLVTFFQDREVLYLNAALEEWNYDIDLPLRTPQERTLYHRYSQLEQYKTRGFKTTALIDHGANPGLVSHFVKAALVDIAQKSLKEVTPTNVRTELEETLFSRDYAKLARTCGVKVIHISEKDSQVVNNPKRIGEFVNTWSIDGLIEEAIAPAEMGWGTHERKMPPFACEHNDGPKHQICLAHPGHKTVVRSWVPSGEILGLVIRHGEAYTITRALTSQDPGDIFRPTVHYAYGCNDGALLSLHELEALKYTHQEKKRIFNSEIIAGKDELGVLLMGHRYKSWWYGSILDIHEARRLVPGQNATTVQVAAGLASGLWWILNHPTEGILVPDDLPYQDILDIAKPYLGQVISQAVDWSPAYDRSDRALFGSFNGKGSSIGSEDEWQFCSFLVN